MFLSAVSNNDVDAEVNALVEDVLEDLLGCVQSHSNNIDAPSGLPKSPSCVPSKSAKTMWQEMAYRAIRKKSDEEVFTPAKFNGDVRSNQDIVMESPNLTPRPCRRGTLGSLSDVLMDMKIEDEASSAGQSFGRLVDQDVVMASPVTTPRPGRRESPGSLSHALMGMKMKDGASPAVRSVQRLRDSVPGSEAKGSVSTPTDLPRIKLVSPPPPAKLDYSPTKMDGVLPKRSLFDSPVPVTDPNPPAFISDSNPELGPRLKSPISLTLVSTNTAEMRLGSTSSFVGDEDEEPKLKSPVLLFSPTNGENERRLGSTSSATKISIRDEESDVKLKIPSSPKCIESPIENGGLSVFFNELIEDLLDACHQRVKEPSVYREPTEISTEKPGDLRNTCEDNVVEAEVTPNIQVSTGPLVLSGHSDSIVAEKARNEDGIIKVIHPQIQSIDVIPKLSCSFDEKSIAGAMNENSCQQTDGRRKMSKHSSLKSLKPQGQSGGTPKTVKFCEAPPLKISPKPSMETQSEDDMEFLLKKIKSMKARKEMEETETADSINTEASFALPSTLDLPDLSQDVSDDKHTFLISGIDVGSHYLEQEDVEKSVLASHGGDFSLSYPNHLPSARREVSTAEATMTVLQHQAILLDKDKQIAAVGEEVLAKNAEIEDLLMKIKYVDNNNSDLEVVVAECAKTVSQLEEERLKEVEALMESKEKLSKEFEQSNEDLQVTSIDLLRIFHIPSFL